MFTSCQKYLVESSRLDRNASIMLASNPEGSKLPEQHEGFTNTTYLW